ncbi:carotenoid 1,2-hydratase [Variovorax sp. J22P240]|uniref:lipocalin-like domain-containing protein n=1 Tax=Variovorax sp. J22P240 TaxID=3053514 RepID=UPI0025765C15|nr:carotenoid 1,2-hydratase [Variovorax sp. J22P240]MDL9998820.1 carotenoid 1,2-hydratase [Variovorax sp. J22P240]
MNASSQGLSRRAVLLSALAVPAAWALPPRAMQFPRDFGSHPDLRTEWWYITGHAKSGAREFGFQLTFFRSRVEATQSMRSAFAARQLIFAHAAITDLEGRKLWHDQRIARAGFGVAYASEADTDVRLRDWTLRRDANSYVARLPANGFAIDLRFNPTQPVMLQGSAGLSRKGPDAEQASYYYSEPQLASKGSLSLQGRRFDVQGTAWLDREWSEAYLHPDAAGWDWIGMNLFDGGALMAFRIRGRDGSAIWAGGSLRTADGHQRVFGPDELHFDAEGTWTSPRTRAVYPTRWRIQTPAGAFAVRALLDDQELDGQGSTGTVYWEGLSNLLDASGKSVGRGYLELTGYAQPLRL